MTIRGRLQDEERGVTLVIVALSLIAIFAMVILTVDVGGLLYKRRAMVNGSDAAALAAAFSCARTTDSDIPENIADGYAADNVSGLLPSNGGIVAPQTSNCDTGQSGYVTVQYSVPQQLWFAGVLGFGNSANVTTAATAAWGPTGGGNPLPIVLNLATFQGNCDIPNVTKGTKCYLWYDNDRFNGSAFGFMDLKHWGLTPDTIVPRWGPVPSTLGSTTTGPALSCHSITQATLTCARLPGTETATGRRLPGGSATYSHSPSTTRAKRSTAAATRWISSTSSALPP